MHLVSNTLVRVDIEKVKNGTRGIWIRNKKTEIMSLDLHIMENHFRKWIKKRIMEIVPSRYPILLD